MQALAATLADGLARRRAEGLLRERLSLESAQGAEVLVGGQRLIAFCSNDYLGLANDPRLVEAMQRGAARWGVGSGASHLVSGHMGVHEELEEALAAFTGRARALLFSSGYAANLGVSAALLGRGDAAFEDRLNHASLLDGALLSGARLVRFAHGDAAALDARLQQSAARRRLVAVDGVFSMDGDSAPLEDIAAVAERHGAWLQVDDAHGFGVLGANGGGSVEAQGLDPGRVPVLMCTLGKALGCAGAFVAGSRELVETLVQHARTYVFTTAMPPALAAAALEGLRIVAAEPWRRATLRARIEQFRRGARELGLSLLPSLTPIQPLVLGEPATALAWAEALRTRGLLVPAIRPPTVPKGSARLRITLSATHTESQVGRLLEALAELQRP